MEQFRQSGSHALQIRLPVSKYPVLQRQALETNVLVDVHEVQFVSSIMHVKQRGAQLIAQISVPF